MVPHRRHRLRSLTTTRLYYTDAALLEFDATIVEVAPDGSAVYLDRTAFYPTSGGQPHDTGTLGGAPVVDVVDEEDRIRHVLGEGLTTRAGVVRGRIDAGRRHDHMQQHTGQHLLSALFEERLGLKTVSVHFGAETSTLDLEGDLTREQLLAVQAEANAVVAQGRPVSVTFEDAAAAAGLRKPPDRSGDIRIVSIDGVDRSACGGTHVASTAQIGTVLVRGTERVRKTTRVQFLCGDRAVARARADYDTLAAIAAALSTSIDEVPALVAAQSTALRESDQQRRRMERELATHRARELHERAIPAPSGRRTIVLDTAPDMESLRTLAQAIVLLSDVTVIGVVQAPPSVLFGASEDTGIDAGRTLREALLAVGGKGGGSPRTAQGAIPSLEVVPDVVERLRAS